ncbi:MAG TPA: DUF2330 domain-containing protein [Polyangiaceae bacterium]
MTRLPFRQSRRFPSKPRARRAVARALVLLLTFLACALRVPRASACAMAFAPGVYGDVAHEDAIIVWDENTHVEQFIRSAEFHTGAKSFGFLVPTPSRPTVAEADAGAAQVLAERAKSETERTVVDRWPTPSDWTRWYGRFSDPIGAAPSVEVLEGKSVAGLDMSILTATSADAIADWLGAHGFALRPALRDWLAIYIAKKWDIVAFHYPGPDQLVRRESDRDGVRSAALDISFSTDEPVYPYREPEDTPDEPGRLLRLFVVSRRPMAALLGGQEGQPWRAERVFAKAVDGNGRMWLPERADPVWLTEFIDPTTKRPPIDVTFRASASLGEVAPLIATHHLLSNLYGLVEVALGAATLGATLAVLLSWLKRRFDKKLLVGRGRSAEGRA